jgi:hypothetical protein
MKRRAAIRVLVFLLLGAAVNVAVAWGCALLPWRPGYGDVRLADQDAIDWWRLHAPAGFPDVPGIVYEGHRFGNRGTVLHEEGVETISRKFLAIRSASGWPMVSLEHTSWTNVKARTIEARDVYQLSGWPFAAGTGRSIPLRPVMPGFAVNTAVYATMLWLAVVAAGHVRRRRRIGRGECPACAYPVGTSAVCTECGGPVKAGAGVEASS